MWNQVTAENNGSSYGLFTIVSLALGSAAIAIDQSYNTRASHIVLTVTASAIALITLVNLVSLFWRIWVGQCLEISPKIRFRYINRLPWQVVRVMDSIISWNLGMSYLMLLFWVWDTSPDRSDNFTFCDMSACQNIWAAWNICIMQTTGVFSTGLTGPDTKSPLAVTFGWVNTIIGLTFMVLIGATLTATAFERAMADRARADTARLPQTRSAPPAAEDNTFLMSAPSDDEI